MRRSALACAAFLIAVLLTYAARRLHFRNGAVFADFRVAAFVALSGVAVAATAAYLVWRAPRRVVRTQASVFLIIAAGSLAAMTTPRGAGILSQWPFDRPSGMQRREAERMTDELRAVTQVAASLAWEHHRATGTFPADLRALSRADGWSLPAEVRVAVGPSTDARGFQRLTAMTDLMQCTVELHNPPVAKFGATRQRTTEELSQSGVDCARVDDAMRLPPRPTGEVSASTIAWTQYRGNPERTGAADSAVLLPSEWAGWRARMGGPARASASIVGDMVLTGAHGNGFVEARDLRNGQLLWRAQEPNWIHQEAVSDGTAALFGFGDNSPSFRNRAPSGVSARELRTGALRWRRFTTGSVMTGAVISSGIGVVATSTGETLGLDLATGDVVWRLRLPGGAIMAPGVARNDTVVFMLDPDRVCALSSASGRRFWCRVIPTTGSLGHSSPMLHEAVIEATSTVALSLPRVLRAYGIFALMREVFNRMVYGRTGAQTQYRVSLSLTDGAELGRSPLGFGWWNGSHTSGTATRMPGAPDLYLLAPVAHRLVRLLPTHGPAVWSVPTSMARGPVIVRDGRILVMGMNGDMTVFRTDTGAELCGQKLRGGYDRAGPAIAGRAAVFLDMEGGVYAAPLERLMTCSLELDALHPVAAAFASAVTGSTAKPTGVR